MSDELRVACAQMMSGPDKDENLERAELLVQQAARQGADVVVLPEHWNLMGNHEQLHASAEDLDEGVSARSLREWARRWGIAIVGGSIMESRTGHEKLANTCVVADRDGSVAAIYRKIHLFDVFVGGVE